MNDFANPTIRLAEALLEVVVEFEDREQLLEIIKAIEQIQGNRADSRRRAGRGSMSEIPKYAKEAIAKDPESYGHVSPPHEEPTQADYEFEYWWSQQAGKLTVGERERARVAKSIIRAAFLAGRESREGGLERLSCARCGKEMFVYGPAGNPNMEVCGHCHVEIDRELGERGSPLPEPPEDR